MRKLLRLFCKKRLRQCNECSRLFIWQINNPYIEWLKCHQPQVNIQTLILLLDYLWREQVLFIKNTKLKSCSQPWRTHLFRYISSEHETTYKCPGSYSLPHSLPSLWKVHKRISQLSPFDYARGQHPRANPRHVHGSARIYVARMAQFVLRTVKLPHIKGKS